MEKILRSYGGEVVYFNGFGDLDSCIIIRLVYVENEISSEKAKYCIKKNNTGFLLAPFYNDGCNNVKEVRFILKIRYIFNILSILINTARPNKSLIGVYSKDLILLMSNSLIELGIENALVLHGSGLDEFAIHGDTFVA